MACGYKAQLKKGRFLSHAKIVKVPFQLNANMLFVDVLINGSPKRFILDSGAPNVIDQHIQDELNFKVVYDTGFKDALNRSRNLEMVKVDSLKFGEVTILNSVAAVADFSKFTCLNIDGIIGTNIMSHFDWEIDYTNEIATLFKGGIPTDSLQEYGKEIPFTMNAQKSPFIDLKVGKTTFHKVEIDLGSNGGIGINKWKSFEPDNFTDHTWVYGETSIGIHGPITDTTRLVRIEDAFLGEYAIEDTKMTVKPTSTSKIGNRFFKNFDLILSWSREAMYLKANRALSTNLNKDNVYLGWKEDGLYIKGFTAESALREFGIEIGDKVLKVADINTTHIAMAKFCSLKEGWNGNVKLLVEKVNSQEIIELVVNIVHN